MTNPECYRVQRHYDEAANTLKAAEEDMSNSSPDASPFEVRRARVETAKREQLEARDRLLDHSRDCLPCKTRYLPG